MLNEKTTTPNERAITCMPLADGTFRVYGGGLAHLGLKELAYSDGVLASDVPKQVDDEGAL